MNVQGLQEAVKTAATSAASAAKTTSTWLGKNVRAISVTVADYAQKAGRIMMEFLKNSWTYLVQGFNFAKAYAFKGFYTSRDFIMLHKEAAMGVGAGVAVAMLGMLIAKSLKSEN
ncbi:MAG: hypothetical protein JXA94_03500 [Parachlamydiales bacterium]|nr:hypothetical protein [Parachlamydiales bacterium]